MAKRPQTLILILGMLVMGCNHLFYYPDNVTRVTPDKFDLAYEDFYVHTRDGTRLHGWMIRTPAPQKPRATIVHFHGNAENISSHFLFFAWLVDEGYDLVVFDYRGYGSSQGEPTRAGLVEDGFAIMTWVQTYARTKDLIVAAQSLGGAVAIPVLAQKPPATERIRAIILDSTFSSYRRIARDKLDQIWLTWPLQWPLSFLVSDQLSPRDHVKDVPIPLLFVHSPQDPTVPYALGRELYEASLEPKQFWDVSWGGHTSAFLAKDETYRARLIGYLDHLLELPRSK